MKTISMIADIDSVYTAFNWKENCRWEKNIENQFDKRMAYDHMLQRTKKTSGDNEMLYLHLCARRLQALECMFGKFMFYFRTKAIIFLCSPWRF